MTEKIKNYEERLFILMDNLAESVAEMTDGDLLAEILEEGEDVEKAGREVRHLLLEGVKNYQQRRLRAAEEQYERRIAEMREEKYTLPETVEEQRKLLTAVFARHPAMEAAFLTAQHREFKDLTDADVESYLRQLQKMGVLDDLAKLGDEA